jgi:hypothetical protein
MSRTTQKNRQLLDQALAMLEAERPMTLRQLYYRLVSAGALAPQSVEYRRLGRIMTRARELSRVPLTWIVDHVRSTLKPSSWSALTDFGEAVRDSYRKDLWEAMPVHLEIFVEKDAIAGTLQPVTEEYDVRLHVCRGHVSLSFAGSIAALWKRVRKPIFAYYLGDFDPSGFDIERDLCAKLARYSGKAQAAQPGPGGFCWRRLAVLPEGFANHGLIRLRAKAKDRRTKGFLAEHGPDCAEVDALPPSELRRRVRDAITGHIDTPRWQRLLDIERLEKETIDRMLQTWGERNRT